MRNCFFKVRKRLKLKEDYETWVNAAKSVKDGVSDKNSENFTAKSGSTNFYRNQEKIKRSQKRYNNEDIFINETGNNYKLQPFKLSKQFCPICGLFFCSYHKLHDHDKYNLIFKDTDYSSYEAEDLCHISLDYYKNLSKKPLKKYLPSYGKNSKFLHDVPLEPVTYRCPDNFRCFFYQSSPAHENIHLQKLKKNEVRMVQLLYKIVEFDDENVKCKLSPCFLALHFPQYTCYEFNENLGNTYNVDNLKKDEARRFQNENWNKGHKNNVDLSGDYTEKDFIACRHLDLQCGKKCDCGGKNNVQGRCTKICACHGPDGDCRFKRKYCLCSNGCSYTGSFTGKVAKNECPCAKDNLECDPNYCSCFCQVSPRLTKQYPELNICQNTNVLYNVKTRLWVRKSIICAGMGLFAGERFEKDQFIGGYYGEVIDQDEEGRRSIITGKLNTSYIFTLRSKVYIDSLVCGNKLRYVNHNSQDFENCVVRMVTCNGMKHILFFARIPIDIGNELFFDYGQEFTLDWKANFDNCAKWFKNAEKSYKTYRDDRNMEEEEARALGVPLQRHEKNRNKNKRKKN